MSIFDILPPQSLIVSCQADPDTPTNFTPMIVAFAQAAVMGGAAGLRVNSAEHVAAIREQVQLPIIAIQKYLMPGEPVLITGDHQQIPALIDAGAEIIAFDATDRKRPSDLSTIVETIHDGGSLALADIRQLDDLERCLQVNVDAVATTLSVWDLPEYVPDIDMIRDLRRECDLPIIAEGNYWTPDNVKRAFDVGAHAVVVGSAITRPWRITEYFLRGTGD
jgi:putative N-acetylmannosamine-6-phosphate epimerase